MTAEEKVSLIIATRNRAERLRRALESVYAQKTPPEETIVVDDASTDETAKIAEKFPTKYIRLQKNGGWANAINVGIKASRNELVAIIDDDVILDDGWLENLVRCLREGDVNVPAVRGRFKPLNNKIFNPLLSHYDLGSTVTRVSIFNLIENCLYRKTALTQAGLFSSETYRHEALNLALRLQKNGNHTILYTPHALAYHDYANSVKGFLTKSFRMGFMRAYLEKKYGAKLGLLRGKSLKIMLIFIISLILSPLIPFSRILASIILLGLATPLILYLYALVKYKSPLTAGVYILQRLVRVIGVVAGMIRFKLIFPSSANSPQPHLENRVKGVTI